jgi:hypothetical protein
MVALGPISILTLCHAVSDTLEIRFVRLCTGVCVLWLFLVAGPDVRAVVFCCCVWCGSDPEKRRIYDQVGSEGLKQSQQPGGGGGGGGAHMHFDPFELFAQVGMIRPGILICIEVSHLPHGRGRS